MSIKVMYGLNRWQRARSFAEADDEAIGAFLVDMLDRFSGPPPQMGLAHTLIQSTSGRHAVKLTLGSITMAGEASGPWSLTLMPRDMDLEARDFGGVLVSAEHSIARKPLFNRARASLTYASKKLYRAYTPFTGEGLNQVDLTSVGSALRGPIVEMERARGLMEAVLLGAQLASLMISAVRSDAGQLRLSLEDAFIDGDGSLPVQNLGSWTLQATSSGFLNQPCPSVETTSFVVGEALCARRLLDVVETRKVRRLSVTYGPNWNIERVDADTSANVFDNLEPSESTRYHHR